MAKFAVYDSVAVSANPAVPDVVDTPETVAYADVVENPEVYANPTVSAAETVTFHGMTAGRMTVGCTIMISAWSSRSSGSDVNRRPL